MVCCHADSQPLMTARSLVPTPRALELRLQVGALVDSANAVLRPAEKLDPKKLERRFTLRTSEGFVETFGPRLLQRLQAEAPKALLQLSLSQTRKAPPYVKARWTSRLASSTGRQRPKCALPRCSRIDGSASCVTVIRLQRDK